MSFTPSAGRGFGSRARFDGASSAAARWGAAVARSRAYRAAMVSARTIHALVLREAVTRYGGRSAGYVWTLVEPLLQLTVMIAIFGFLGRSPAVGDSMVVFFMTGIIPIRLLRTSLTRGAKAIPANRALMNYPQVRAFEVITARAVLESVTIMMVVIIVILFMKAFQGLPIASWISDPLELLAALMSLQLLCYGACFLSAQIGRYITVWADMMGALGRALFFTSGIWFTLDTLPPAIRKYAAWNPVAQNIEWIRDASISGFDSLHFHPLYPVTFGLTCLVLGLFIEWLTRLGGFDRDMSA